MKTLIICCLLSVVSLGQNFPGEKVELLLNKEVQPKEKEANLQKYGYRNFYLDYKEDKNIMLSNKRPFPKENGVNSDYSSMRAQKFRVTNILKGYKQNSVLELTNDNLGVIYYDYDPRYGHSFELEVVGGLEIPDDFYCDRIERKEDKFDNSTRYYSPQVRGDKIIKTEDKNGTHFYLSMNQIGATLNVGKRGLFLLLDNGEKLSWEDAKIDVEFISSGKYRYSAFVELNKEQIQILSNQLITDVRIYIYDGEIENEDALSLQGYLKCLSK